ncbi:DNA alkylation repair protein [Rhizobium sp. KVB221]|uniref:DNA alkylation repair protein n=1 Tax=Rhizobium setariae TaxID=2801340 RepID=A0A936YQH0_9HYPH|nr:DNA alkylation repair protein [Rhizobium setariae]MBL0374860.1 DNA alkylation repair protein [Rhizobium setariae]
MTSAPGPTSDADDIIAYLRTLGGEKSIEGMSRHGINTEAALGISNAALRPLARQIKRDHARAALLWASGIREARLLATFTDEPKKVTAGQARQWANDFNSWEIVDHAADLFGDAGLQTELTEEFAEDDREFVRRAAFAMVAWSAVHMKKAPDADLLAWLPLIERHASDPRNFVKKAVNWALRQIGKRNAACHAPALALAEKLVASADRTERWIGKDAARELTSERIAMRLPQD